VGRGAWRHGHGAPPRTASLVLLPRAHAGGRGRREVAGCLPGRALSVGVVVGVAKNGMAVAGRESYPVSCVALPVRMRRASELRALSALPCSLHHTDFPWRGRSEQEDEGPAEIQGSEESRASEGNGMLTVMGYRGSEQEPRQRISMEQWPLFRGRREEDQS
jgi:hypothetical protein